MFRVKKVSGSCLIWVKIAWLQGCSALRLYGRSPVFNMSQVFKSFAGTPLLASARRTIRVKAAIYLKAAIHFMADTQKRIPISRVTFYEPARWFHAFALSQRICITVRCRVKR
jgi:hypothetical protein